MYCLSNNGHYIIKYFFIFVRRNVIANQLFIDLLSSEIPLCSLLKANNLWQTKIFCQVNYQDFCINLKSLIKITYNFKDLIKLKYFVNFLKFKQIFKIQVNIILHENFYSLHCIFMKYKIKNEKYLHVLFKYLLYKRFIMCGFHS